MKRIIIILVALAALVIFPSTSFANSLVATSPIAGASLESAPNSVTITTEFPLLDEGNDVVVTDPTGARVDDGALTIDDVNASIGLRQLVKTGIYTVEYTFLSDNDLPLIGKFTFNFVEPVVIAKPEPVTSPAPMQSGNDLGTTIFVFGLLAAALIVTIALSLYARKLYRDR
jgi:methionine-rich copper-binding protein CopC